MQKTLVVLLAVFILSMGIIAHGDDSITRTVAIPASDFETRQKSNFTIIDTNANGYHYCLPIGAPMLPQKQVSFLVDTGTTSVSVSVSGDSYISGISAPVLPNQKMAKNGDAPVFTTPDSDIYGNDSFYPKNFNTEPVIQICRGIKTVSFFVNPVRYNPVTSELKYYKNLKIRITCQVGLKKLHAPENNMSLFADRVKKQVLNPDDYGRFAP